MEKKSSTFDKITDERNIKSSFKASSYPYLYLPVVILIHLYYLVLVQMGLRIFRFNC